MIPQIFHIGPLPINSFGLMVALGLVAAVFRVQRSFAVSGIDPALAEKFVMIAGISGLVGARVWYVGSHLGELSDDVIGALVSSAGFVFFGGFLIAALALVIYARYCGLTASSVADSMGPALALAYAIGRVGCQLSGDGDYGIATNSFIGMSYATGVVPTPPGVNVYPAPFFESVLSLGVLWLLTRVETSPAWRVPGRRFGLALVLLSIERFLIEFIRVEDIVLGGLTQAQVISIGLCLFGLMLLRPRNHLFPAAT